MAYDDPNASGDHFERSALEDTAPLARPFTPGRGVSLARARLLGVVAGIALLAVLGVALFHDRLPSGPAQTAQARSTAPPEPTLTLAPTATIATTTLAPPLPAFSDWRVAYLGEDTLLHIVSIDGKTQLTGPSMPMRGALGAIQGLAAASPDGRNLAYTTLNGAVIMQSTPTNVAFHIVKGLYYDLAWSPQSDILALGAHDDTILLWRAGQTEAGVIHQELNGHVNLIGWIDESHLAIQRGQDHLEVASLNIATGAVHSLTTFAEAQLGSPHFDMEPDGRHILMSSCASRGEPYIHRLGLIDTATGAYRTLANARAKVDSCLQYLAFQRDTGRVATDAVADSNPYFTTWVVDPQRDSATLITNANIGFPVAWASGGGPIITSTASGVQQDGGPYTIRAVPASFAYEPSATTLTTAALTLPAFGLVRNA
jgi:hypothetical protein